MSETNHKPSILFLDDEAGDESAATVNAAIKALAEHFDVMTAKTLPEASELFNSRVFDVFVLDIDMSHVPVAGLSMGERGSGLAQVMRSLDSNTAIVMFSNMGLADDWSKVANHHVFGYIHKSDEQAIDDLVAKVQQAVDSPRSGWRLPQPRKSGTVLVYRHPQCSISESQLRDALKQHGDFEAQFVSREELMERAGQPEICQLSAVVYLPDEPDSRPGSLAAIDAVTKIQPKPNVVFALRYGDTHRESILRIVNARPFRLINLNDGDAVETLGRAVFEAAYWYGGNELFRADEEAYRAATVGVVLEDSGRSSDEFDSEEE